MKSPETMPLVIIGTSGSTDYLHDTGDRRFWPVRSDLLPNIEELFRDDLQGDLAEPQDDEYDRCEEEEIE